MTNMILGLMYASLFKAANTSNPLKLSFLLLISSTCIFFYMYMDSSQVWFPTLYLMIFSGGILMMFMILSSILPNEKMKKSKISVVMTFSLITLAWWMTKLSMQSHVGWSIPTFLSTGVSAYFFFCLMTLYFFLSISVVSMEKAPMRSLTCWKILIL